MRVFIAGTDTGVGKTVVAAWLSLQTKAAYWKPIQCGTEPETDRAACLRFSGAQSFPERYCLAMPRSPHVAAQAEGITIRVTDFTLPAAESLVVEGAGGLMVPLNDNDYMIDLVAHLQLPLILVARGTLGTLNHTLLSIEAVRQRSLPLLGVILSGESLPETAPTIEHHGRTPILAQLPTFTTVDYATLSGVELTEPLRRAAKLPVP